MDVALRPGDEIRIIGPAVIRLTDAQDSIAYLKINDSETLTVEIIHAVERTEIQAVG